jgi:hypothetical protein
MRTEVGLGVVLVVVGGIHLAGDYGSILARGENPFCISHGYSSRCSLCPETNRFNPVAFAINSGNNYYGEVNGPCSCDSVIPYKYLPDELISSPNLSTPDIPHSPYLYNLHELPIKRQYATKEDQEQIERYYKVAKQYYDYIDSSHTRKWALVIAPEDLKYNDSTTLSWGMRQAAYVSDSEDPVEDGVFMGTPYLDGLIGTRMFDKTNFDWVPWFVANYENKDEDAYQRWVHTNNNLWDSDVDIERLKTDKDYFVTEFRKVWEKDNKENSAMRLISDWNDNDTYNRSDWYIPSLVELMYIYGNINLINTSLLRNGMTPLAEKSYWSSTTGARSEAKSSNKCVVSEFTSTEDYDSSLESKSSQVASHAHRAFTQNFQTGLVESHYRSTTIAGARPVRRVPLFDTTYECELNNHLARYVGSNNGDCYNCLTCNCN